MIGRKTIVISLFLLIALGFYGCDNIFGSKDNSTTEEIFEEGRIDPTLEQTDGYAALTPFWGDFNAPTDVFVGFDGFVYVTDAEGVHALDRADLAPRRTIELPGAVSVTQDRLLNLYVTARYDTVVSELPGERGDQTWNLPAVYKIKNLNGAGEITYVDTLIHPFADNSRNTTALEQFRLDRSRGDNDELVEFTGVGVLRNNNIYISRRGPRNNLNVIEAPDNTVLEFVPQLENGEPTGKMNNSNQFQALNPGTPSLTSAINLSDITTFVNPPQRDVFPENKNFLMSQGASNQSIAFRVLQVNVVETPSGTEFQPNQSFLERDTSRTDGFLYEEGKFEDPAGLAVAGDQTGYIFVVDKAQHRLYQFKPNGQEGIDPPPAAVDRSRNLIVSFGSLGNGPRQFNSPSGVAYYDEILYVADTGNNRIARYKLTTDFE
ncbi:hypothetical protein [Rhodohalobacter sp. 8-1]|uniref:hypothetical protein n=1 Tax=Rhodohalobacter sp. 8-1 TaxID=3131972 RepID=UPI0030EF2ACC